LKITITSIGKTNRDESTLNQYQILLQSIIQGHPTTTIFLLPEYAWGDVDPFHISKVTTQLQSLLRDHQYLLYGSYVTEQESGSYNTAGIVSRTSLLGEVQKTNVLDDEKSRNNVVSGVNPGAIEIEGIRVGIVICADLWNGELLTWLVEDEKIDLLLIPAFTVVPPDYHSYAKIQWYSLAIVRSREFLIPLAIADHSDSTERYAVGAVTSIVDPSLKQSSMRSQEDFLILSDNHIVSAELDLDEVQAYRQYRVDKGLYQKNSSSES